VSSRVALLAIAASFALACAHPGRHGEGGGGQCKVAECPMHEAKPETPGARHAGHGEQRAAARASESPGHGMHARMHGAGGMQAEHAERHAAIARLVAIEDIQQLKARYMRCIDTRDLPCLRDTVFTPDTELHFKGGDYEISVKGWPEIEKFYQGAFTPTKFGMHNVHTPEIAVSGDTATGTWYLHDVFVNLGANTTLQGSALYRDDYVRTGDGWRIAKSTYQRLWEETTPRDPRTQLGSKPVRE
jgi:hypothetical protein